MAEENPIVPAPPAVPEITAPPVETTLDLGGGNLLNKAQALEMKTAKEGLQTALGTANQTLADLQGKTDKLTTDYSSAAQARATAEAGKATADARVKELELRTDGFVSKETHATLQEKHDLMVLKSVVDRTESLAKAYGKEVSMFAGKSVEQIDAMEELLKAGGTIQKAPTLPGGGGAPQSGASQTAHQGNVDAIAAARAAQKK